MMILIIYDINTQSEKGKNRLRKVSNECLNWGNRVQESVYECEINFRQLKELEKILKSLIDETKDSIRIYSLGNNYKNKIINIGKEKIIHKYIL